MSKPTRVIYTNINLDNFPVHPELGLPNISRLVREYAINLNSVYGINIKHDDFAARGTNHLDWNKLFTGHLYFDAYSPDREHLNPLNDRSPFCDDLSRRFKQTINSSLDFDRRKTVPLKIAFPAYLENQWTWSFPLKSYSGKISMPSKEKVPVFFKTIGHQSGLALMPDGQDLVVTPEIMAVFENAGGLGLVYKSEAGVNDTAQNPNSFVLAVRPAELNEQLLGRLRWSIGLPDKQNNPAEALNDQRVNFATARCLP